jgi:hypothetical protein
MEGKNMSKKPELTNTVRSVHDEIDAIIENFTDLSDVVHFKRWFPSFDMIGMDAVYNEHYLFDDLDKMFEDNDNVVSYTIDLTGDHLEGVYELAMYSFVTVDGGHGSGYFYYEV